MQIPVCTLPPTIVNTFIETRDLIGLDSVCVCDIKALFHCGVNRHAFVPSHRVDGQHRVRGALVKGRLIHVGDASL